MGFVDAAAVEFHRRDGALRWRCKIIEAKHTGLGLEELVDERTQQRTVNAEDIDIVDGRDSRELKRLC